MKNEYRSGALTIGNASFPVSRTLANQLPNIRLKYRTKQEVIVSVQAEEEKK